MMQTILSNTDNIEGIEVVKSWMSLINIYPVVITDEDNKINIVNENVCRLWKRSENELIGKSFQILLSKIVDLTEEEKKKEMLENTGKYCGYLIIRDFLGKEYLARININQVLIMDREFSFKQEHNLNQFIVENNKNMGFYDYLDMVEIKNEIFQNLRTIGDIKELEAKLKIDYRRILFLFKKFEGLTPKKYLSHMKIERCIKMLRERKFNCKEIAYELGYCDVSHLCKSFREKTGKTLNEFKNEI